MAFLFSERGGLVEKMLYDDFFECSFNSYYIDPNEELPYHSLEP